jgi:hypothetical protein
VAATLTELALDGLDLSHHHTAQAAADRRDGGDLETGIDEPVRRVLGGELHIHKLAHPVVRDLHAN